MKKGLVVKIKKDFAILLTDEHEYVRVNLKDDLIIGNKVYFIEDDVYENTYSVLSKYKKQALSIAAVACLMLFAILGGNINTVEPYALVSIDINPSLEITIDDNQDVIEIMPLNSEAYDVYDENMIDQNIMEVIEQIIVNAEGSNYLSKQKNNILISSVTYNEDEANDLSDEITRFLEANLEPSENIRVIYIESDLETVEEAKANQVSIGKQVVNDLKVEQEQSDETADLILEENVVVEDLDDLEDSYLAFIERLLLIPDSEENYEEIAMFLSDIEELTKDENNIPTEFLNDYPSLVLMKNRARDLWKPYQKEYQKLWAESQNGEETDLDEPEELDLEEPEEEDLDGLYSFVSRLHYAKGQDDMNFDGFLEEHFIYDSESKTYTLDSDEKVSDLIKEAKSHWDPIKQMYQKGWAQSQEPEEATDDESEAEELDKSEVYEWLEELALSEDQDVLDFVEDYRAILDETDDEQSFKEVKMIIKERFMSEKKKSKSNKQKNNNGKKN